MGQGQVVERQGQGLQTASLGTSQTVGVAEDRLLEFPGASVGQTRVMRDAHGACDIPGALEGGHRLRERLERRSEFATGEESEPEDIVSEGMGGGVLTHVDQSQGCAGVRLLAGKVTECSEAGRALGEEPGQPVRPSRFQAERMGAVEKVERLAYPTFQSSYHALHDGPGHAFLDGGTGEPTQHGGHRLFTPRSEPGSMHHLEQRERLVGTSGFEEMLEAIAGLQAP